MEIMWFNFTRFWEESEWNDACAHLRSLESPKVEGKHHLQRGGRWLSWSIRVAIIKYHKLGGFYTIGIYFLLFWKLASPRSRHQQIWFLVRTCSWFIDGALLYSHIVEGARELFYKGTSFIMKAPPTWSNHLQNIPCPDTITLGIKFQWKNLEVTQTLSSSQRFS